MLSNKTILTDSGYWIGLIDARDQYHEQSIQISSLIENYQIVVPWPSLYETISTRLIRRRQQLVLFEQLLLRSNIRFIEDTKYKDEALNQVLNSNRQYGRSYSLVDSVIREMLKDVDVRINFFVTFNGSDFIDICQMRQIEIIG